MKGPETGESTNRPETAKETDVLRGFVTTSHTAADNRQVEHDARSNAERLGLAYVRRRDLKMILQETVASDVLVFYRDGVRLSRYVGNTPASSLRFHPSTSLLRIRNLSAGGRDVLEEATGLVEGGSLLDCTMGLCTDSIVASAIAGPSGKVTALEGSRMVFEAIDIGIRYYRGDALVEEAAGRVKRLQSNYREHLRDYGEGCYDIVYMDPMFTCPVQAATPIDSLRTWAISGMPDEASLRLAVVAARRRLVVKVRKGEDVSFLSCVEGFREFYNSSAGSVRYIGIEKDC